MKNRIKRLMVCGLCVTMLAGCGNDGNSTRTSSHNRTSTETDAAASDKKVDIKAQKEKFKSKASSMNDLADLKNKYEEVENYEYTEPMFNLEKNHTFTYEMGENYLDKEDFEAFEVYRDSDLKNTVDLTYDRDYDNNTLTICPGCLFDYDDQGGSSVGDNGTWGSMSKFWLVQYMDTQTGEKLSKPLVTVFTIENDLNTPTMKQSVGDDGYYKLSWSPIEGADYYEVYKYDDNAWGYADLQVTTDKLECAENEFNDQLEYDKEFKETFEGTDAYSENKWLMNAFLDMGYGYFVVGKSNDGKRSGMSNLCDPADIGNQIPITVHDDFQYEYTCTDPMSLPAYVDVEMLDGSVGKFVIEYYGASASLLDDGSIIVRASIRNLPISMQSMTITGADYDELISSGQKLKEREDEIAGRTGVSDDNIEIPYVPENPQHETPANPQQEAPAEPQQETPAEPQQEAPAEPQQETPANPQQETPAEPQQETPAEPQQETPKTDDGSINMAGVDLPQNVADTVYANSSMSEWLAINFLAHNERVSLDGMNEASDSEKLSEAISEAYRQNPLCGIINDMEYDYNTNSLTITYAQSKEETQKMQQESINKAKEVVGQIITEGMSDYEKEVAINNYLCDNATYNYDVIGENGDVDQSLVDANVNSFTPYGVLVQNLGVCESYAEAFHLVANEAGLPSIMVIGTLEGGGHEWNRVMLDGKWYTLDVTNNDKEIAPNSLFNLSDSVAGEILKQESACVLSSVADQFVAEDMDHEFYTVSGLATSDTNIAKDMLIKGVNSNGNAAVRMNAQLDNTQYQELLQSVANASNAGGIDYYIIGNVIGVAQSDGRAQ